MEWPVPDIRTADDLLGRGSKAGKLILVRNVSGQFINNTVAHADAKASCWACL